MHSYPVRRKHVTRLSINQPENNHGDKSMYWKQMKKKTAQSWMRTGSGVGGNMGSEEHLRRPFYQSCRYSFYTRTTDFQVYSQWYYYLLFAIGTHIIWSLVFPPFEYYPIGKECMAVFRTAETKLWMLIRCASIRMNKVRLERCIISSSELVICLLTFWIGPSHIEQIRRRNYRETLQSKKNHTPA